MRRPSSVRSYKHWYIKDKPAKYDAVLGPEDQLVSLDVTVPSAAGDKQKADVRKAAQAITVTSAHISSTPRTTSYR